MNEILSLAPQNVWKHFYSLTQVPRPSGHLAKVQSFLLEFGKNAGVEAFQDEAGNIIYRKPATPGMENRKTVILQAHMDMVPQKNKDTQHDFENDPIQVYVDGEWVKAKGTTLGSDNGMGVAAIMAVMEDKTLKHGPLVALITADEETGMYGAFGLKPGEIEGDILLNLDSEEEGELYIGCAGGEDLTATLEYKEEETDPEDVALKVTLKGLRGGHSGIQIGWGHANANKLMARFLNQVIAYDEACLVSWEGGNMRNAIPRECEVVITVPETEVEDVLAFVGECEQVWRDEFATIEEGLSFKAERVELPKYMVPEEIRDNLVDAIYACPNGVERFIPTIPDTVETSSNLAIVEIANGKAAVKVLTRTSRESLDCALALQELVRMGVDNIITFDAHDPRVQNAIPLHGFETVQPAYQFIKGLLRNVKDLQIDADHMMVISPDEGGMSRAIYIANVLGLDMGMFSKRRDYTKIVNGRNPIVAHEFLGTSVEGKDMIIIDDMISSGESVLEVAAELKERKARNIFVFSTFGLFTNGLDKFDKAYEEGIITKILTTNLCLCWTNSCI